MFQPILGILITIPESSKDWILARVSKPSMNVSHRTRAVLTVETRLGLEAASDVPHVVEGTVPLAVEATDFCALRLGHTTARGNRTAARGRVRVFPLRGGGARGDGADEGKEPEELHGVGRREFLFLDGAETIGRRSVPRSCILGLGIGALKYMDGATETFHDVRPGYW